MVAAGTRGVNPQSSDNAPHTDLNVREDSGHYEVLNTLSTMGLANLMVERVKAWDAERSGLLHQYESIAQDLKRERESTITKKRKVFKEMEKVAKEKERADEEKNRVEEVEEVEEEFRRLKEEKSSLEIKFKEIENNIPIKFEPLRHDLGSVASKQALYMLLNFVREKTPGYDFSRFIVGLDASSSPDFEGKEEVRP
ncbi:hypothetical protein NE237_027793 [Protea cynaroides]|uniref:Uncharacterized protein n=1 Tax=Protea cynaroides TaxID=273540 RepID=A0A9Q0GN61_9MAGN|nr:hypothetical protein NE237_027793 [Protea cynaroides]